MTLFYAPYIISRNTLTEEESTHAVRVLRLAVNDEICVTDGRGLLCTAKITLAHPKHCTFEIIEQTQIEKSRKYHLQLAVAPTKNIERFEWLVEKVTEIGADTLTPLLCRFSERKTLKEERLEKIVVAACKQSQNIHFTEIQSLTTFENFLKNDFAANTQKFIAHCYEGEKPLLKTICQPAVDTLILIGPEGDFSRKEVALAEKNGFRSISLGSSRLRTETAGIVACTTVEFINQ